ncbi:MAG: hypothetical protein ABFD50_19680 [Smithella sp.]
MSLILDALKKLEQETAARKERTDKVSVQILRSDHAMPDNKRMVFLAVCSAIAGALLAVALVNTFSGLIIPSSPTLPASTPVSPHVSYSQSQPSQMNTVQSQSVVDKSKNFHKSNECPASSEKTKKLKSKQKTVYLPKAVTIGDNKNSSLLKNYSQDSISSFTISGIIWYEDRRARRAVVNDMVVGENSVVNGAKIAEIKPDRVRFSKEKKMFDVILGKNTTEFIKGN